MRADAPASASTPSSGGLPSAACPPVGELSAFSRGALPLTALKSIAEHISVCPQCESKVSTLVSDLAKKPTVDGRLEESGHSSILDSGSMGLAGAHVEASRGASRSGAAEAPTAPLRLGQYRLVRQIGRGGMGVVYQAWHERLLRDVAIKFVPVETVKDLLDVERLRREMAAAGTMRHANVVYATDAGEAEGIHYLVMEYVEGIDLSKLVSRLGPLPVADACEIVRQAAGGLAHIEQQKLVHRDLKPSNLMLARDGTVKILDLGLARFHSEALPAGELTQNGYLLGTIDYVSPEQARHAQSVDIRSDIYGLGCTFFKLLAGEPPFGGSRHSSVAGKILAHERTPPPPLSDFRKDVPADVEAILRRMLAKEPLDRFQTPAELRRALKPLTAGSNLQSLVSRAMSAEAKGHSAAHPDIATPATLSETTQERPSTAPAAVPARRRKVAQVTVGLGVGAVLCLTLFGLWLLGLLPGTPPASRLTAEDITERNIIRYPDLTTRPGTRSAVLHPRPGVLTLDSELIQLVGLGQLKPGKQSFAVSIDQPGEWIGQVGIFLGYHELPNIHADDYDYDAPVGMFQLIHFVQDPASPALLVIRERAFIHPKYNDNPHPTQCYLAGMQFVSQTAIPFPAAGEKLHVVIRFDGDRMEKIAVNGHELDDLTTRDINTRFTRSDYRGALGLFNAGNIGGASFSNFDFSGLDKE